MNINQSTYIKKILTIGLVSLAVVSLAAGAAYKSHVFASTNSGTNEVKDAETSDDNKTTVKNVQDGETNDNPSQ